MIPLKRPEGEEQKDAEIVEDNDETRPDLIHIILLNRTLRIIIVMVISAILLPIAFYLIYFSREITEGIRKVEFGSCSHPALYHVPCGYENITSNDCLKNGCCYSSVSLCYHSLPSRYQYELVKGTWTNDIELQPARNKTPFNNTASVLQKIKLSIFEITENRMVIEIRDPSVIPLSSYSINGNLSATSYSYKVYQPMIFIEVNRFDDNQTLFTSSRGPLIATKNFLEWNVYLGGDIYFGLGESVLEIGQTKLLFNNGYNAAIPFIMAYDIKSNSYHGVIFNAPGPVEVELLKSKLFIIRSMFSGSFQLEILVGPTPADVYEQLKERTQNNYFPPYWSYGVHYCKMDEIYNETATVLELKKLLDNSKNIFDSHCYHENLFWMGNNAISENAMEAIQSIKLKDKKFMLSFTPHLEVQDTASFNMAKDQAILLLNANHSGIYSGKISNNNVAYIDWLNKKPESDAFIRNILQLVKQQNADGYFFQNSWLRDDNKNQTTLDVYDHLTFVPRNITTYMKNMASWDATLTDEADSKIIYKYNQLEENQFYVLTKIINETDKFFVTSSYGIHTAAGVIMRNITVSWMELTRQVNRAIGLSIAGLSFSGVPACGDVATDINLNEELCIRWYQFSSLLPLFRISTDRIPSRFSSYTERIMNNIIKRRYSLTEYFHQVISSGESYLRPLYYYYPSIRNYSAELVDQFLIGRCIMAAPVLLPKVHVNSIYFPDGFYELWGGQKMPGDVVIDYAVVETDLPLFIRSGCIIPLHESESSNVLSSRLEPLYFIIALRCNSRECRAIGSLNIDRDLLFDFEANEVEININPNKHRPLYRDSICNADTRIMSEIISTARIYGHPSTNSTLNIVMNLNLCTSSSLKFNYASSL